MLSCFSHVQLFTHLWTLARQALLSMGFSRQEYWSGLPCPPPGDLPDSGIKSVCLTSPALAGGFFTTSATEEALGTGRCPINMCLMKEYMKVPWWAQPEGHLTYWGSGPKKAYDPKDN